MGKEKRCSVFELISEDLGVHNMLLFNTVLLFTSTWCFDCYETKIPTETGSLKEEGNIHVCVVQKYTTESSSCSRSNLPVSQRCYPPLLGLTSSFSSGWLSRSHSAKAEPSSQRERGVSVTQKPWNGLLTASSHRGHMTVLNEPLTVLCRMLYPKEDEWQSQITSGTLGCGVADARLHQCTHQTGQKPSQVNALLLPGWSSQDSGETILKQGTLSCLTRIMMAWQILRTNCYETLGLFSSPFLGFYCCEKTPWPQQLL